jgi:hypothetical protein
LMRFFLCLPLLAIATPSFALDMPARKAGLWEIKITMQGRAIVVPTAQHCIDAATDKEMNTVGNTQAGAKCSKQDIQRNGAAIVVDSVCDFGTGVTTTHAVVTGDFNSAYTVTVNSKREGAATPGRPAESNMMIEAKWLGACTADQKPGDMIMAGRTMNIMDLKRAQGAGAPGAPGGMKK